MQKLLLVCYHSENRATSRKYFQIWLFPRFGGNNGGVLSMRMHVILDSLFARPGSAPIWGRKKGEFRDWTNYEATAPLPSTRRGWFNEKHKILSPEDTERWHEKPTISLLVCINKGRSYLIPELIGGDLIVFVTMSCNSAVSPAKQITKPHKSETRDSVLTVTYQCTIHISTQLLYHTFNRRKEEANLK